MFEHAEIGAGALLGVACFALGAVIRAGHARGAVARTYLRGDLGPYPRTTIFAFMPLGAGFFCISVAAGLIQRQPTGDTDPLASVLLALGVGALVVAFWWMFRTPTYAKPAWVRDYDRALQSGSPVPDLRPPPMSPRAYAVQWLALAALSAIWLALALPLIPLLIGIGAAISLLVANRPHNA